MSDQSNPEADSTATEDVDALLAEKERIARAVHERGSTLAGLIVLAREQTVQIATLSLLAREQVKVTAEERAERHISNRRLKALAIVATVAAIFSITASGLAWWQGKSNAETLSLVKSAVLPDGEIAQRNAAGQDQVVRGIVVNVGDEVDAHVCIRIKEALAAAGIDYTATCPEPPSSNYPTTTATTQR